MQETQEPWVQSLGLGRSPEEGNDNQLQYSCLGNPMDRGDWRATVHGVTKESDMTEHTHMQWIPFRTIYKHAKCKIKAVLCLVTQSHLTLCDSMDYTVHGILQTRILDWVAFHFSSGSSQPRNQTQVSHIVGRFFTS